METTVTMRRKLFGEEISQRSDNSFLSMTDLCKVGNKWRLDNKLNIFDYQSYFKTKQTKDFLVELEKKYGKIKISARGRGQHTWIHPILFIDMAFSISPQLKIETYEWLYDNLIQFRNDSGDSYKKMCGALFVRATNKTKFHIEITEIANKIKLACNVQNWQTATEDQLKKRDRLHDAIALLSDVLKNNEQAVKIAILKAVK